MSIVRVGLSEADGFGEGYDAIFGKKKEEGDSAKKTEPQSDKKDKKKKTKKEKK